MVMLSKNFSLDEMCKSQTADRLGIANNPTADAIYNMGLSCREYTATIA
jgi:hypothetical protein